MSLQTEDLSNFWRNIRGARRRDPLPLPAPACPDLVRHAANVTRLRRGQIRAETLASDFIRTLGPDDYAFQTLKAEFDGICEEAEIDPVSPQRFARWLKDHGGKSYRTGRRKVTMYAIRRRPAARLAG